jgi:hypothetical protein
MADIRPMREPRRVVCARCGADFGCDSGGDCWCMRVDARLPMPGPDQDCVCADCLRALTKEVETRKGAK